jgi:hypothetical protein
MAAALHPKPLPTADELEKMAHSEIISIAKSWGFAKKDGDLCLKRLMEGDVPEYCQSATHLAVIEKYGMPKPTAIKKERKEKKKKGPTEEERKKFSEDRDAALKRLAEKYGVKL